ncbi:Protein lifeguard 2 [Nibea albiflora]|uniref:Protein lifeguard 2 n=1 Tax=Nibea albiflora TaxID=240163 RepID=A0ACB7F126_NIBAL|nr:Protein lifeguard 2 [Nibea albiflora]
MMYAIFILYLMTVLTRIHPQQVGDDNEPPTYQEATAGYAEMEAQFAWDDKTVRRTFIRKVYAILMVQLLVTVGIVSLFSFCAPVRFYIQTHPGLYMASYFYNTRSVVLCLGITAVVCLSVTIFSFQSKIDVTSCQGVLFSLCMVMLLCAITISIVVPFGYVPWLHAIYAVGGAILFTLFLAFDTQLLLGNKRYSISPEEYIFATLSIYLDIIYLFSFLLQIMGGGRE